MTQRIVVYSRWTADVFEPRVVRIDPGEGREREREGREREREGGERERERERELLNNVFHEN